MSLRHPETCRRTLASAGCLLFLAAATAAAGGVSEPPAPSPAPDLDFPDFQEKTLANGLRVVVIEHHEQPAVSLRLVVDAGLLYEPAEKVGVASATAALLTQGTESRSAQEIARAIDFVGGSLSSASGTDLAYATASLTSDQLDLGLELLADVVLRPAFPEEEIERWRTQALNGLQVQLSDPSYVASAAFDRLLFGEHPYGRPDDGTPDSVRAIDRDDLVAFHGSRYLPNVSILAIVGDVAPADAFAKAEKAFGGWTSGEPPKPPPPPAPGLSERRLVVIDKEDAVQTEIRVGHLGLAYTDPDYFVAEVYNSVLGGSSGARLNQEVRRERGLSYGARSSFSALRQPGRFLASTYTKTETTVEALDVVLEVIASMPIQPLPPEELEPRKTYIAGSFPLSIETPDGIATQVLEALSYGLGKSHLEGYTRRIEAVGSEEVKRFAEERVHPEAALVVLVGDAESFIEALEARHGSEANPVERLALGEVDLLSADLRRAAPEKVEVGEAEAATARALAEAARAAHGGDAFVGQRTQVVRGSGSMAPPGVPQAIPVTAFVRQEVLGEKVRTEITLPMGTMVRTYDGEQGWMQMMGQSQDMTAQIREGMRYGFDVLRRSGGEGWSARPLESAEVELGEGETVIAEGFELSDAEGHATRFWVDPESRRVVKVAFEVAGQALEEVYAEHREVSGVVLPVRSRLYQNGARLLELEISEIEIDPEIDPGVFAKPGS